MTILKASSFAQYLRFLARLTPNICLHLGGPFHPRVMAASSHGKAMRTVETGRARQHSHPKIEICSEFSRALISISNDTLNAGRHHFLLCTGTFTVGSMVICGVSRRRCHNAIDDVNSRLKVPQSCLERWTTLRSCSCCSLILIVNPAHSTPRIFRFGFITFLQTILPLVPPFCR